MSAAFVTKSFENLGYLTSEEWLNACIEWCKESQPNQTNSQILNSLKEQYLLCDIRQDGIQAKGNKKVYFFYTMLKEKLELNLQFS